MLTSVALPAQVCRCAAHALNSALTAVIDSEASVIRAPAGLVFRKWRGTFLCVAQHIKAVCECGASIWGVRGTRVRTSGAMTRVGALGDGRLLRDAATWACLGQVAALVFRFAGNSEAKAATATSTR